jgi:hypothetical protein
MRKGAVGGWGIAFISKGGLASKEGHTQWTLWHTCICPACLSSLFSPSPAEPETVPQSWLPACRPVCEQEDGYWNKISQASMDRIFSRCVAAGIWVPHNGQPANIL